METAWSFISDGRFWNQMEGFGNSCEIEILTDW